MIYTQTFLEEMGFIGKLVIHRARGTSKDKMKIRVLRVLFKQIIKKEISQL